MRKSLFYGYVVAAAGFGVWFVAFGIHLTFSVFFVPVSTEFHWARADVALASSLSIVMMGLLSLVMGWLTDKLGPRFVVTFFGSFLGLGCLLLSRVTELWQFILCHALVFSIGTSTASVPIMATVSRWFVKRRGLISGIVQSGLGVGGFIIAPLTAWLISAYGWRTAYVVLAVIAFVGIIASGLFLGRDPRDMGLLPDGAKDEAIPTGMKWAARQVPGASIKPILRSNQFWILAGLYFAFGFCRSTFTTHVAPHVQDLGFTLADAANVLAIINVSSIVGRIGMGRASDVMGMRFAMVISYGATVLDILWGLVTRDLWGLYVYAFIFGFGWGAQAVLRYPATAEVFGLRSAGLIMGILGMFENVVGAGIGIWLAGHVFDRTGTYWPVYWAGLGIAFGATILAGMVRPVPKPLTPP